MDQRPKAPSVLRCVRVGSDLIVMDLDADGYAAVLGEAPFGIVSPDTPLSEREQEAAWASRAVAASSEIVLCTRRPDWTALDPCNAAIGLSHLMTFLGAYREAARMWARYSITEMLERLPRPATVREPLALYAAAAARFDRIAAWCIGPDQCLFRTLVLQLYLGRNGLAADWIIGVRLYPFRAHSWLATGDNLISETPHRVAAYAPILIWPLRP